MKKKLQVVLDEESWAEVERIATLANNGFENGHISYSDVLNEMALCSSVDLEKLQTKHTNVRKSLRLLAAQKDLDIEAAIKSLQALKKLNGSVRKTKRNDGDQICPAT